MIDKMSQVSICPECREAYPEKGKRHRYAEKSLEDLVKMKEELSELKEERNQLSIDYGEGVKRARGV